MKGRFLTPEVRMVSPDGLGWHKLLPKKSSKVVGCSSADWDSPAAGYGSRSLRRGRLFSNLPSQYSTWKCALPLSRLNRAARRILLKAHRRPVIPRLGLGQNSLDFIQHRIVSQITRVPQPDLVNLRVQAQFEHLDEPGQGTSAARSATGHDKEVRGPSPPGIPTTSDRRGSGTGQCPAHWFDGNGCLERATFHHPPV